MSPYIQGVGGKANYLVKNIILFYCLIKWELINYLIKKQNLFLIRKYVSYSYTIGSSILKVKDLFGMKINNKVYLFNQIGKSFIKSIKRIKTLMSWIRVRSLKLMGIRVKHKSFFVGDFRPTLIES